MKSSAAPLFPSSRLLLFLTGTALALTLASCYESASSSRAYTGIAGDEIGDDYVYYPTYEVYYSTAHRQYVYWDGRRWVRETTPRQAWVHDIGRAPSVHMEFHDSPEHHHREIVRRYPRTWRAPAPGVPAPTPRDQDRDRDHDGRRDSDEYRQR